MQSVAGHSTGRCDAPSGRGNALGPQDVFQVVESLVQRGIAAPGFTLAATAGILVHGAFGAA